jgi:hypothetical protein
MDPKIIFPIWFIFSAVFLYLAYTQYKQSQDPLRPFYMRENRTETVMTEDGKAVEQLTASGVEEFNKYLEMANSRNKKHYTAAAVGYFVASAISLVSMFLMTMGTS